MNPLERRLVCDMIAARIVAECVGAMEREKDLIAEIAERQAHGIDVIK